MHVEEGTTLKLLRWIILGLALLLLSLAIWFAGPLIAFSDYAPLAGIWVRVLIILPIWLVVALVYGIKYWRRRKAEKALEEAVAATEETTGDSAALSEKMTEALETLKRSSGKRSYLYSLPWYVMIGPPGAGKTTALLNSGLKFPLHDKGISSLAGTGGTRYCDWWFAEDAVLIDTAGRYTTQDSDAETDRKSWRHFLSLLKKNRSRQPINGVLIAISVADLMTLGPEELELHASAVRKRLLELHEELKVEFPVYAIFTKADLIAGFNEYFGGLTEDKRRQVWGATFQVKERRENRVSQVAAEIDDLVLRLTEETADRLQEEPDPLNRIAIFGFPSQVANLRDPIADFLAKIFEPTRYRASVNLRGFYFTSGTQEGTPIDQLLGSMQTSFASPAAQAQMSSRGKSYFLYDLLTKVIYQEAGWVSKDMGAIRREVGIRYGLIAAMLVAAVGFSLLWTMAYRENTAVAGIVAAAEQQYRFEDNQALAITPVDSVELDGALKPLAIMRDMRAELATREASRSWFSGFGMGQQDRIMSAGEDAYRVALERTLRPRLVLRLERQLAENVEDPAAIYEPLKVYLMLGGAAPKIEDDLVLTWMRTDWEVNLLPGPAAKADREQLEQYLADMLEFSKRNPPMVTLDANLVDQAQKRLASWGLADRAYALIKSAAISEGLAPWRLVDHGGVNADVVFRTTDDTPLEDVEIDGLYTFKGFQGFLIGQLNAIPDKLAADLWVLGKYGQQDTVESQFDGLVERILEFYDDDFIKAWEGMLAKVKLNSLSKDKPKYVVLSTASQAATSPIISLFKSIRDEAMLTEERETEGADAAGAGADVASQLGKAAAQKVVGKTNGLTNTGLNILLKKSQNHMGEKMKRATIPGEVVQAHFLAYQQLVDGDAGKRPIDSLIQNLYNINLDLTNALDPTQADKAAGDLQNDISNLRLNVSRLPVPLGRMMEGAIAEFEGDSAGTTIAELNQKLVSQITAVCRTATANQYPFSRKSAQDVPMGEFTKLFAPNGLFDRFFADNLMKYADTSGETWAWRKDTRIGQALAPDALLQFQRAADIKNAFFFSNSPQAGQPMVVRPNSVSGNAEFAILDVNGTPVEIRATPTPAANIVWPGAIGGSAGMTVYPEMTDRQNDVATSGPWAFMRLLGMGKVNPVQRGADVSFVLGGREVSFSLEISTDKNPFGLPALSQFKCPGSF